MQKQASKVFQRFNQPKTKRKAQFTSGLASICRLTKWSRWEDCPTLGITMGKHKEHSISLEGELLKKQTSGKLVKWAAGVSPAVPAILHALLNTSLKDKQQGKQKHGNGDNQTTFNIRTLNSKCTRVRHIAKHSWVALAGSSLAASDGGYEGECDHASI